MKYSVSPTRSSEVGHAGYSRRKFIGAGAAGFAGSAFVGSAPVLSASYEREDQLPALSTPSGAAEIVARDEDYWERVAAYYPVSKSVINLESGFWGMMPAPVFAQYMRHLERVNLEGSYYARRQYLLDLQQVRVRVAAALRVDVEEIAFTRNATEALQALIGGYNRLRRGDAVLYADSDYPSMQYAMNWLADRRGVRIVRLAIPEPANHDNVLGAYSSALAANPGVRLLLVTHLSNKSGLIFPVPKIVSLARQSGADVIVDAAHSWGQTTITVPDIGADFIGFNLHKWIGAPLGVGLAYIRKGRLNDVDRMMADEDNPPDSILSRVHTGTMNFAALLSVPMALDFHDSIGPTYKAARLAYLRNRWVNAVRDVRGLEILTPDDPAMVAAITSFRLRGLTKREDNDRIVEELLAKYGLFTVTRSGLDRGDCVRVTPSLYNCPADVDRLAEALKRLSQRRG